jgi:hypothetical protein
MSLRRLLSALLIVLAVAGLGYTAYWFHVAGEVRKQIRNWSDARRAAGWTVEMGEVAVHGFPAKVRATIPHPHLAAPSGVAWRGETLELSSSPFTLGRIEADSPGHHRLTVRGREAALDAGSAHAVLAIGQGRLRDVHLTMAGLILELPDAEPLTAATLDATFDPVESGGDDHREPSARFSAMMRGVTLPAAFGAVLDRQLAFAEVSGRMMGRLDADTPLMTALAAWSDDGGTVELDHVVVDWSPLALEGEGTLALDPRLQPLAALTARISGFGTLMDRLARAGVVDPGSANAAKMLLALMAKSDGQGRAAIPVPISLQDGLLYLGPARVARLPPIAWGD